MTPRPPIVAVIYAEVTAPVVRSQTPPLLRALRELGHRVDSAVFTSPRALLPGSARSAHDRALASLAAATGVKPMRRTHLPRDRGIETLGRSLAKTLVKRGLAESILFCRQPRAALVGLAARDAIAALGDRAPRVVLDLRGIRDVEYLLTLGKAEKDLSVEERARLCEYRGHEEIACRRADAVLTVSRPMEKLVGQRYDVAANRLGRVPCHAEPVPDAEARRDQARIELGVAQDALLVAYSGTLAAWQMPDASVRLFQALKTSRPDARLLFLTPDTDAAAKVLAAAGVEDALLRSAPPGEAARLLTAADYGLLLRQDDLVNRVACPVKFGEYLACGVRPILTPHIGDQSKYCEASDLGVVTGIAFPAEAGRIVAADATRPGNLALEGRDRRRKWATENIAPARAAARVAKFLDGALAK